MEPEVNIDPQSPMRSVLSMEHNCVVRTSSVIPVHRRRISPECVVRLPVSRFWSRCRPSSARGGFRREQIDERLG